MNTFRILLRICGLSPHDLAFHLKVPPKLVKSWQQGETEPPSAAIIALGKIQARQQEMADEIIETWEQAGRPPTIFFTAAKDNQEARTIGWPSVAAQVAPAAIAQGVLGAVKVELDHSSADIARIAAQ